MTKTKAIIISIILMTSALIIKKSNSLQAENDFIGFFAGVVFGAGIVVFLQAIIKNKVTGN